MSFADGLRVVKRRGEAMQEASDATPSGMVSVLLLDLAKVESIRERASAAGYLEFANFLCPGNLVLSGEKAACEKAAEIATAGRRPGRAPGGCRGLSYPADEAGRRAVGRSPGIGCHSAAANSGDFQCRRPVARRSGEDPREISCGRSSVRCVGKIACETCSVRSVNQFFEVGPGSGATGNVEADRPESGLPDGQRFAPLRNGPPVVRFPGFAAQGTRHLSEPPGDPRVVQGSASSSDVYRSVPSSYIFARASDLRSCAKTGFGRRERRARRPFDPRITAD